MPAIKLAHASCVALVATHAVYCQINAQPAMGLCSYLAHSAYLRVPMGPSRTLAPTFVRPATLVVKVLVGFRLLIAHLAERAISEPPRIAPNV